MAVSSSILPLMPTRFGVLGYIAPLVVITAGYALFQTANNTTVMTTSRPEQRGVISGLLNVSRNLGLITGASVMGAVFAFGSATTSMIAARPEAVAAGMRLTFAVATILIVVVCPLTLEDVAAVAAAKENAPRAAYLLGTAAAIREAIGTPQAILKRNATEQATAAARAALGEEAWEAAFKDGLVLSVDQAIAYALE